MRPLRAAHLGAIFRCVFILSRLQTLPVFQAPLQICCKWHANHALDASNRFLQVRQAQMPVVLLRDHNTGMPENLRHFVDRDSLGQEPCRKGVPQVMELEISDTRFPATPLKAPAHVIANHAC